MGINVSCVVLSGFSGGVMNYIGFYWTLPVPWAGFNDLPSDPDEAAKASKTIRYQVERVRRWVNDAKGVLVAERVFLEIHPDRGSESIVPEIDRMIALAQKKDAQLVLVDFSEEMRWRKHGPLWDRLNETDRCVALDPIPMTIDFKNFIPSEHFSAWRKIDDLHAAMKPHARAALQVKIGDLKAQGSSYAAIAAELNENAISTVTGKPWTADNVRKMLANR